MCIGIIAGIAALIYFNDTIGPIIDEKTYRYVYQIGPNNDNIIYRSVINFIILNGCLTAGCILCALVCFFGFRKSIDRFGANVVSLALLLFLAALTFPILSFIPPAQ